MQTQCPLTPQRLKAAITSLLLLLTPFIKIKVKDSPSPTLNSLYTPSASLLPRFAGESNPNREGDVKNQVSTLKKNEKTLTIEKKRVTLYHKTSKQP